MFKNVFLFPFRFISFFGKRWTNDEQVQIERELQRDHIDGAVHLMMRKDQGNKVTLFYCILYIYITN